jgi:hypothetical protein
MPALLNTWQIAKHLKEAGFSERQAEAVTMALHDSREADLSLLATKVDLGVLRAATKADPGALRADLNALRAATGMNIVGLGAELRGQIEALRQDIDTKLEILRRDITIRFGSMIVIATGVLLAAKFFG